MGLFWTETHIVMILGLILGLMLTSHIILQKRSSSGTMAWLLVIIFLPYIGVPLYFMLGGRKMRRRASQKNIIGLEQVVEPVEKSENPTDHLLQTYNIPAAAAGNDIKLCTTGEDIYKSFIELIESATKSIYISTYVYAKDDIGKDILPRLVSKASKGVEVKLLLDGVGSLHTHHRFFRSLIKAGGQISYFMPVLHRPFRGRANLRNHRKILLVDGQKVIAGGTNIATEYMGPTPSSKRWHDLSFVLEGPAVVYYAKIFAWDWEFASGKKLTDDSKVPSHNSNTKERSFIQVVPSGPDVPNDALYDSLLSGIYTSQERLWIVTPYFVPDEPLVQALILACRRGVDVRIIIPKKSNHLLADIVRGEYLREIQRAGGKIFFYTKGMMHAKVLLIDNQFALLGSVNIDIRSLFLNYEIAVFVYNQSTINQSEEWINKLLLSSQEGIAQASLVRRLFEGTVRILTPLL
ncbi:MAG TPA: cardiolipin synthase [Sedimentisphaerales bacterium]|nr:cardiolipin synthase [Sedimentisphaerales bacterium]